MDYTVTQETFDSLDAYWKNPANQLKWDSIFILPSWLKVWWQEFCSSAKLYLTAVRQNETIIGIAPLKLQGVNASFVGDVNVCDYEDFVILPGKESEFFNALLDELKKKGVSRLELGHVRPESTVIKHLGGIAKTRGYETSCRQEAVSLELDLPPTWEDYLSLLTTKQRHELRRKMRRLEEMGNVNYRVVGDKAGIDGLMDAFLKLFSESREDKAVFLTPQREAFFRSVTSTMAEAGMARLGILEVDAAPVAMVLYFEYNDTVYLYNSGYDLQYGFLSAGLLSKALCIKDSIERHMKRFDFLKGNEVYKYHLAGKEVPLYTCRVNIE